MITSAYSHSPLLNVTVTGNYPYNSSNNTLSSGMVRYNSATQSLEVYDGVSWYVLNQSMTMTLAPELESVVAWAKKKQAEEAELETLCQEHPGLQEAYERLEIMKQLVKKEMQT